MNPADPLREARRKIADLLAEPHMDRLIMPRALWQAVHQALSATREEGGWIVASGDGQQFRAWQGGCPCWTNDRGEAIRYARRQDAEAAHEEDEDAWSVLPYEPSDHRMSASEAGLRYRNPLGETCEIRTADEMRKAWSDITEHSGVWPHAKRFLHRIGMTDADGNALQPGTAASTGGAFVTNLPEVVGCTAQAVAASMVMAHANSAYDEDDWIGQHLFDNSETIAGVVLRGLGIDGRARGTLASTDPQASAPEQGVGDLREAAISSVLKYIEDSDGLWPQDAANIVDKVLALSTQPTTISADGDKVLARPEVAASSRQDLREVFERLVSAATQVSHRGATTGPQWVKLNAALAASRAALLAAATAQTEAGDA
jgi:hypothetical protein